eukprot:5203239-Alexandrium_andersonii.AAC.1
MGSGTPLEADAAGIGPVAGGLPSPPLWGRTSSGSTPWWHSSDRADPSSDSWLWPPTPGTGSRPRARGQPLPS